jgi:hypothetical protein
MIGILTLATLAGIDYLAGILTSAIVWSVSATLAKIWTSTSFDRKVPAMGLK